MIVHWYTGLWELLAFAIISLIIVLRCCGVPGAKKIIVRLASKKSKHVVSQHLYLFLHLFYIKGLSLVVGALLAKKLQKNLVKRFPSVTVL